MLKSISSDIDFRNHLRFDLSSLDPSQLSRLSHPSFKSAIHKLKKLSVDLVADLLRSLYSSTGRPANDPALYIRSFILMQHFHFTSINLWCDTVAHDSLFQFLIGSSHVPNASSHYDFINRLSADHPHRDLLFSSDLNSSIPSSDLGLIDSKDLVLSGDGSALHIHASPFGHKVLEESSDGRTHRFSAPEADSGWDSDLGLFYHGFTLYNISYHNPTLNLDLPCFLSIEKASRHDALTTISATAQFLAINPDLHPRYMCFDSASDNYATHYFLRSLNIIPIIDINRRNNDKNLYSSFDGLNDEGIPVCMNGTPMVYNGYEAKKCRNKYRCPLAMDKIESCPHKHVCCPDSSYGKVRYVKEKDDIKLFGPVPYKSDQWKEIYKNRTCTERMNNRYPFRCTS